MADLLDRGIFPVDPWRFIEVLSSDARPAPDAVFTVSNGFVGLQGVREEDAALASCFVNGFYETWPLHYPEVAYGLAKDGQAMQPVPNPTHVGIAVNGFKIGDAQPLEQRRVLDMASGVMSRETVWQSPAGRVLVQAKRLVSLTRRGLVMSQITVTPDQPVRLELSHGLALPVVAAADGPVSDPRGGSVVGHQLVDATARADGDRLVMDLTTARAGLRLSITVDHKLQGCNAQPVIDGASANWSVDAKGGQAVTLGIAAWFEMGDASAGLDDADWDVVAGEQRQWLNSFWSRADIVVDDPGLQQAIRWNLFQAIQASARADGLGIGAKGQSGSGYDGHYFWDMEMYVLPMLTYTAPDIARSALEFRRRTLPQAIERAQELHLEGALYPWRTIDGHEASAYYEAGTAQYHIDADVAHALTHYVAATGDDEFMLQGGLAMLIETARLWACRGFWGEDGAFHFHYVTGPDEYTALVDDNVFTNLMARDNLMAAADAVDRWGGAEASEVAQWRRIAGGIFIAYDEQRGVHPQDAGFLQLEPWDLANIPPENFPLLLHYHPLTIYRHRVIKQADVVLAQILCPQAFTAEQKRANFDFYDPLTTGDSTLSAVPQAIAAAEVGHLDLAAQYLDKAVFVDLADLHHNTSYGVHLAVAAGIWSAMVLGFGGLRDAGGSLSLWPRLPTGWGRLEFALLWRGSLLRVAVLGDKASLSVDGSLPVALTIWGQDVVVSPGTPLMCAGSSSI